MRSLSSIKLSLFFSAALAAICVLLIIQTTASQKSSTQPLTDPVKIVEITSGKKNVNLDRPFENGDDWLEDFKIRLKNISDKPVVYVEIKFNFPDASAAGNELSFGIEIGNMPGIPANTGPMLLKPNDEQNYQLDKNEYRTLAKFVKDRRKSAQLNTVKLKIGLVVFSDLSGYSDGQKVKQDRANPRRWIPEGS